MSSGELKHVGMEVQKVEEAQNMNPGSYQFGGERSHCKEWEGQDVE